MDIKITRGQGKCAVTGRAFEDGERYVIALSADPEQEGVFQRTEIAQDAWERQNEGAFIAFWHAEYSKRKKPVLLDPDMLWEVFHRARMPQPEPTESAEPAEGEEGKEQEEGLTPEDLQRFAYVAALGLMRLKKLKLSGTRRDGKTEYLVFDTPGKSKDRQTYEVLNPELDEQGVMLVEERLSELV
jgi:hypothetical protein